VWFAPDRRTVLVGAAEGVVVWDPKAGKRLRTLPASRGSDITFSPDGKTVAAFLRGGWDDQQGKALRLWDLATGAPLAGETAENGHLNEVDGIAFTPDGRTVATSSHDDHSVRLWEARTGRLLRTLAVPDKLSRHALAFSPDGKYLFVGTWPAVVRWEVATGREAGRFPLVDAGKAGLRSLLCMHLTGDGRTLQAIGGWVGFAWSAKQPPIELYAWDVASGKRLRTRSLPEHEFSSEFSRFSEDGRLLVVQGGTVYDGATGEEVCRLSLEDNLLNDRVAISADGALVAMNVWRRVVRPTVDRKETLGVQVWEVATRLPVVRLKTGDLAHMAFTPDGRRLIIAGPEALKLWDLASGREVARRPAPGGYRGSFGPSFASSLALAPDGRTVATGQPDTTALVWDLAPPFPGPSDPLTPAQREACWTNLAGADAGAAAAALARLADAPGTVAFLRERLLVREPDARRQMRGVRLLACIGTPEAREVLEKLAKGMPESRLTREAKAALERLDRRLPPTP
jgi:WD40 repeat protein